MRDSPAQVASPSLVSRWCSGCRVLCRRCRSCSNTLHCRSRGSDRRPPGASEFVRTGSRHFRGGDACFSCSQHQGEGFDSHRPRQLRRNCDRKASGRWQLHALSAPANRRHTARHALPASQRWQTPSKVLLTCSIRVQLQQHNPCSDSSTQTVRIAPERALVRKSQYAPSHH